MALRDFIVENFRWKIAAFLLAVFSWFGIQFAIWKGWGDWRNRTFISQRVNVLTAPGDLRTFRVNPSEVDVVIRATPAGARNLERDGVRVFVDLTDVPDLVSTVARAPRVYGPEGIEIIRIEPRLIVVFVEQISDVTNSSLSNTVTTP